MTSTLPRAFYERPADVVAPDLLGTVLARREDDGSVTSGVITEVEAYLGPEDLASHARGGRRTERNESMWRTPGTAYVYQVYGVHFCFNVSVLRAEHPAAVLVRAIAPIEGVAQMQARRGGARDLAGGPGKLCAAMGIDRGFDGLDLTKGERAWIEPRESLARRLAAGGDPEAPARLSSVAIPAADIRCGPRIGVDYAGEWAARPLRWWIVR